MGILIGWCTNAAMVEISINAIFALYFGFFFLFLGGVIAWRVMSFSQAANRNALLVLSCLMGLAGLVCIAYQRHWFFSMSAALRVPIYSILGISLSFALSFGIAELLNYASSSGLSVSSAQRSQAALVQTPQQIFLLAASSVAMGFFYGLIFGFAEIGRGVFTMHTLRSQFIHEERLCLPVGAAIGALTGFLNEWWRPAGGGMAADKGVAGFGAEDRSTSGATARKPFSDNDDSLAEGGDFDPFDSGERSTSSTGKRF